MSKYESFAKPPVEEAIITMRLPKLERPDAIARALATKQRTRYPVFEIIDSRNDPLTIHSDKPKPDSEDMGFRLVWGDGLDVIRIHGRAFSFHRLRPYQGWMPFVARAREAWLAFSAVAKPDVVQSLHLRYLNRFDLPEPVENWGDYLQIHATIPSSLEGLSSSMVEVELHEARVPARTSVTQMTLAAINGMIPVILDIDVRSVAAFRLEDGDDPLWRTLERMREYKNQVFADSLTERARELFR